VNKSNRTFRWQVRHTCRHSRNSRPYTTH